MKPTRLTIRDIAARAGVSKSTVANALKDSPACSKATRERIQYLAREMGYRANPLVAAHLANVRRADKSAGFKATLAYLSDVPKEDLMNAKHPHHAAYIGALRRANELGFALDFFWYEDPEISWNRLRQILLSRGIHGAVFGPHQESKVRLDLDWDCFSIALIGDSIAYPKYHRVDFDHHGNMEELFGRLNRRPEDRIGLAIPESMDRRVQHHFRSAYNLFQEQRPKSLRIPAFVTSEWKRKPFLDWYREYAPETIITVYDQARKWLASIKKRVPRDVRIVTPVVMDDTPHYTGYYLPLDRLAASSIDFVTAQLFRNEKGLPPLRRTSSLMGEWREGKTL